jgi:hypothetical protein
MTRTPLPVELHDVLRDQRGTHLRRRGVRERWATRAGLPVRWLRRRSHAHHSQHAHRDGGRAVALCDAGAAEVVDPAWSDCQGQLGEGRRQALLRRQTTVSGRLD